MDYKRQNKPHFLINLITVKESTSTGVPIAIFPLLDWLLGITWEVIDSSYQLDQFSGQI